MSTTEQQNAISLAVLETEMHHVKTALADVKFSNARQTEKIEEILKALHEARGGWKIMLLMGGAAGSVGALIAWLLSNLRG